MLVRRAAIGLSVVTCFAMVAGACAPETPDEATEPGSEQGAELEMPAARQVTLRVGNYNIQWFGDADEGPTNEPLQLERAAKVLSETDADLWVLAEIVDKTQFEALLDRLPGYDGFLANDPRVDGGSADYSSGEQKLAIVYRSEVVGVGDPHVILHSKGFDFGSRPPLAMTVTIETAAGRPTFTLVGTHMKAMSDAESWERRRRASAALHGFLDQERAAGRSVLVLGDWNDDIDESIASGHPTPFADLASDASYRFLTKEISALGIGSRTTGRAFLDHQLVGGELEDRYVDGSTSRVAATAMVPDYATTTSDHYPIVSSFSFDAPPTVLINEVLANEPGTDTAREFVELVGSSCDRVDLSGYALVVDGRAAFRFPAGSALPPGGSVVVYGRPSGIPTGVPNAFAAAGLGLLNRAGALSLVDPDGEPVSVAAWSRTTDGVSMNRAVDGDPSADFVSHPSRGGRAASPGTAMNGAAFGSRCDSP